MVQKTTNQKSQSLGFRSDLCRTYTLLHQHVQRTSLSHSHGPDIQHFSTGSGHSEYHPSPKHFGLVVFMLVQESPVASLIIVFCAQGLSERNLFICVEQVLNKS